MVKMVSLRKTKQDRQAEDRAMEARISSHPDDPDGDGDDHGGPEIHLDASHLKKLGAHEQQLPEGHEIHFKGRVVSHTIGHEHGEPTSHARVRLIEGGTDIPEQTSGGLRAELEKNTQSSERKAAETAERRSAAKAKSGEQVDEKSGGKE